MSRACESTAPRPHVAPTNAVASAEAMVSKKPVVLLQRPSAASPATASQGRGVIIGFVGQLRRIVACLAGAFGFVEGNPADDGDTRERLRRTCCRAQRF